MKITDVRFTAISGVPLKKPFWNSIIRTTSRDSARVEIYTDQGAVGMAPGKGGSGQFIEGPIKAKLLGEEPFRIEHLGDKNSLLMRRSIRNLPLCVNNKY